ncbi:MAG: M1 family metallopeptidase [Saprospiraceae bacterium]|jgi:hypothetical protein|nr:M1 family metallopeptidase [Saprospiraceae bacterium]
MKSFIIHALTILVIATSLQSQNTDQSPFRQLYDVLPTPNEYRTASGSPGPKYYQPTADYNIDIVLHDNTQSISGKVDITFHNSTPETMTYLWVQLDQNIQQLEADAHKINNQTITDKEEANSLTRLNRTFDGGYTITSVTDQLKKPLPYIINKTMMRIDLQKELLPGQSFTFSILYSFPINDRMKLGGRSGYEYFPDDDNYLYTIAQFFPRMCAFNDLEGWQTNQYLGAGEFTLLFGNYFVSITVPSDHLVAATGTLQNPNEVLSKEQYKRFKEAESAFVQPVVIVNQEEATIKEKTKSNSNKTWKFRAENVRDFAFASSRKFIWDAMAVKINQKTCLAMSMYPKEGNPLWGKYSTKAVAHTLKTYSKFTIDYPYPVAWSINADRIGMEYPMICFNFGRCEKDGTYSERTKYGTISVIIHEVGHNFFPMIINSDERQWAWMDEGLNTFVQYLTEQEFERNYPSGRGEPSKIVDYMKGDKSTMSPIMVNPESAYQLGNNAYAKPATALNILRETILGRKIFDAAFKEYAKRWAFKQPYPADFFRTMEDASGTDLDWFWRSWFFTTDHVDMAISNVTLKQPTDPTSSTSSNSPDPLQQTQQSLSTIRNSVDIKTTYTEIDTSLLDFYSKLKIEQQQKDFNLRNDSTYTSTEPSTATINYYEIEFEKIGGIVMPIIYEITYENDSTELVRIPAEIWRKGEIKVSRVHSTTAKIKKIILDPYKETADIDTANNSYPKQENTSKFEIFKRNAARNQENPMQKQNKTIKP